MKIQYAFLCDSVKITDRGLFNVYGGGMTAICFKKLPDKQPIMLVLSIEYNPAKESGDHAIMIKVIDSNGNDRIEPEKFNTCFADDYNLYLLKCDLTSTFEKYEPHSVVATIDGAEIVSIPLDILPARKPVLKDDTIKARFKIDDHSASYGNDGNWTAGDSMDDLFNTEEIKEHKERLQHDRICAVKKCADELELTLLGFLTNEALELYYNVYKDNDPVCYISKGWGDPGFRIGELIEIDRSIPDFKEKFCHIFKICSSNLVSINVSHAKSDKVELNLAIGVYEKGFNGEVLREALDSLQGSLRQIRPLVRP